MKSKIISFAAIVMLVSTYLVNSSLAVTQSDIDRLKQEQEQAEREKEEIAQQKETEKSELEKVNEQLNAVNNEIMELEGKLNELSNSINEKIEEIEKKQKELEEKEELLKTRLVAMYKNGGLSYLDVLLGCSNYMDMLASFDALERIADADNKLINKIKDEKQELENIKKELEEEKTQVDAMQAQKKAKNVELSVLQDQKETKIASLTEEEKEKEKKISEYQAAIRQGEEEIRRSQWQGGATGQSNVVGQVNNSNGTLGWPLPSGYARYSYITSYFGPRKQPTAGASTNHGALDIGVSYQPLYAAEAGIVVNSGWVSGYGNFIMIWHNGMGQIYTAYAHLSQRFVSAGQTVIRGQQIGVTGNTGITTGPHLHFEVRVGGSSSGCRVDPLNYIVVY